MTIAIPGGAVSAALPAQIPGAIFASQFTPGAAPNATGRDDTAALNAALTATRAITTLGNGIGELWLDAATYFISAALDCHNVSIRGRGPGATKIALKSDWCSALPVNAGWALDMQPSVALPAPTQGAPSQASGSSAYTAGQQIDIYITLANARNGGETTPSASQRLTIATNGNQPTANWTRPTGVDTATTANVYIDRAATGNSANAVQVATGQTGTSFTDTTGTGGSVHPPTTNTTGGAGINCPDFSRVGAAPAYAPSIEGLWVSGPGGSTPGVVPAHVSGIRQAQNSVVRTVRVDGVFAGIFQNLDHERVYDSQLGGYYGAYRGGPAGDGGDQVFRDCVVGGTWASFGVAAEASFSGRFDKVHCSVPPFGFYKESVAVSGSYSNLIVSGSVLTKVAFESTGNGNIFAAGSQTPSFNGNVLEGVESVNAIDPGVILSLATTDWQGVAIGRTNATVDLNGSGSFSNAILGSDPLIMHSGITNWTQGIAARFGKGTFYDASTLVTRLQADAKPWSTFAETADAQFIVNGCTCRAYFASGAVSVGDVVQTLSGGQPSVARSNGTKKVVGVALTPATNGQSVLVAQSGVVSVNSAASTILSGAEVISDTGNAGAVVSSGSPTLTNFVGSATTANSGGFTNVLLQGLA